MTSGSALPVTLKRFTVTVEGQVALLQWTTISETNASHFEIERSFDGKNWQRIGSVAAKSPAGGLTSYTFGDTSSPSFQRKGAWEVRYYRLKIVDLDGAYEYSKIV